jgi:hypothetical protein
MVGTVKGVMMRKVVVMVCILSLFLAAAMLAGCGSGGSGNKSPKTPGEVAKAFWEAAVKRDADTTWTMFSKTVKSGFGNKDKWEKTLVMNDPKATIKSARSQSQVTGQRSRSG